MPGPIALPPRNLDALTAALETLACDPKPRLKLRQEARERPIAFEIAADAGRDLDPYGYLGMGRL